MVKTFSRIFVVSLLVVALTAPMAFATTARVNSLAYSGDYINDDSNIFRWYGTLPSYSNLVMAEVGTYFAYEAYHQALGVTHACGENGKYGTFGVFLLDNIEDDVFYSQVNPLVTPGNDWWIDYLPGMADEVPVNKFAMQWGKEFDGFALGLGFTRSDMSWEDNTQDPVEKYSMSYTTFGGGVRADVGEDAYTDIAVTLGMAGGGPTDTTEYDKKMAFDIAARLFYEWKDYATLVPLVEFNMFEYALEGYSVADGNVPHGDKGNDIRIGVALNLDVNTDNLLIFGVEMERMAWEPSIPDTSADSDAEWTGMVLPTFRLALESDVKPWFTMRVGAMKGLWKHTWKNVSGQEVVETGAYFDWYLGCGFHIAEFDVDCELGPELPFSLGYWLTGHTAYPSEGYWYGTNSAAQPPGYLEGPITRISATYHF